MKVKVNEKLIQNIKDYAKENIPSIKDPYKDDIEIRYSELGDTIVEFKNNQIAVSYGHIMDHMLSNPFTNLMNFRYEEKPSYVHDYMSTLYKEYKNDRIRLIQLFDVTMMNFEYGGAEYELDILENCTFDNLPLTELNGEMCFDLDLRYCDYDHFRFKDKFELVEDKQSWIWACGTSYLDEVSNFVEEVTKIKHGHICPDCLCEIVKANRISIFFDAGHQLLKLI